MNEQQHAFKRVLDLLDRTGCIEHVILIDSWAEFTYREAGVLEGFDPHIRTLDVDFLVRNLRRPSPPADLITVARDAGYFVQSDRMDGTTRLLDTTGLEVEFLINQLGAGTEGTLRTNIGVTAQALRHLGILSANTLKVVCLGHAITVPTPEAYVVHKMVIHSRRGKKAEKDARAILHLWPLLDTGKVASVVQLLSKKERASVLAFASSHDLGHL